MDGIIQEVFNPIIEEFWLEHHEDYCEDSESGYTKKSKERLDKVISLEQELIEKIKQWKEDNQLWSMYLELIPIKVLIGDNQE